MVIDLHVHSICSDGQFTLNKIFKKASQAGIGLISITDHDSINCQEEAKILAQEYGYTLYLWLGIERHFFSSSL